MYWIDNPHTDPAFNLALEEYLLCSIPPGHPGYAVLWRNSPTVVVGRFQNARQEVNADFVRARGIRVVRRLTGGGAVYHDLGTLNYTFIHHVAQEGALPSFSEAGRPVAEALQGLGLPVVFSGRNDLLLEGYKVAGVAHCRKGQRTLHHGTLLVDTDLACLAEALRVDPEKFLSKGVASVRGRVQNLAAYLAERAPNAPLLTVERVREAVMARQGGVAHQLTEEDTAAIQHLCSSVYATESWVYGASPPFGEHKSRRFPWGRVEVFFEVRQGLITGCRFQGDFFSGASAHRAEDGVEAEPGEERGLSCLEAALRGVSYTDEGMEPVLRGFALERIFSGCDAAELLGFLLPGKTP